MRRYVPGTWLVKDRKTYQDLPGGYGSRKAAEAYARELNRTVEMENAAAEAEGDNQ